MKLPIEIRPYDLMTMAYLASVYGYKLGFNTKQAEELMDAIRKTKWDDDDIIIIDKKPF